MTIINTHRGLYPCNRMPFGVTPASGIFQQFMEQLLKGIPGLNVNIDGIIVSRETEAQHIQLLREVLRRVSNRVLFFLGKK